MAGRIPQLFINDLLARTDIVYLINKRLKLKQQGKNFHACCPFHHENTPSFTVNSEKQFYYCFGCGANGNVVDFLMNYDRLEFIEIIEELATMHGLKVPREQGTWILKIKGNDRQKLYRLMEQISDFYHKSLYQDIGAMARNYLHHRGLNDDIIRHFSIGFSPAGRGKILDKFGKNENDRRALHDTGMLVTNSQGQSYDRFRDRVMFPIRNYRGKLIAFGGRVVGDGMPKYLNSPKTELFHKGRQLFGLYEAQRYQSNLKRVLVVEGYMDVLALAQYGIDYAVASLGTTTTAEHIQLLFRATDNVICCYDGDRAGRKAAWHTLETALLHINDGLQIRFMFLPDQEDPDTLVRKEGKKVFEQRIELAKPLSTFFFESLLLQVDLSTPDGRSKLSALAIPMIKKIPSETLRLYLRQQLGQKLGMPDEFQLEKLIRKKVKNTSKYNTPKLRYTTMRILIALLIQNPRLAVLIPSLEEFKRPQLAGLTLFIELVQTCLSHPALTTGQLFELYRNHKLNKQIKILAAWDHMIIKDRVERTFLDALGSLYDSFLEQRLEILIAQARTHGLSQIERQEVYMLNQTLAKKY